MAPELLWSLLTGALLTGSWLGLRAGMLLGAAGGVAGTRWWAVLVGLLIGMGLGSGASGMLSPLMLT